MPAKVRSRRPTISIVGPGNLGSALALTLPAAGYRVSDIVIRAGSKHVRRARALAKHIGARTVLAGKEPLNSDIAWITVPDDAIADIAVSLAQSCEWKGKTAFHSSGALTTDELAPLRAMGARVASVHPMMTFVRGTVPDMQGVAFALEGDAAAVRVARLIVHDLGGKPFTIRKENKVLYHVFGSFASPLVIALMASMEEVALAAGIRKQDIKRVIAPLLRQTLRNYIECNAAAAFSGPLARGDVATVRKHLTALKTLPEVRKAYLVLANLAGKRLALRNWETVALELAQHRGDDK